MMTEKIDLYAYFGVKREDGSEGYLVRYCLDDYGFAPQRMRPAMLVVPGGGYAHRSDREAEPVAIKYLESGFQCFVLQYSLTPVHYPIQLIEGAMAMAYIRINAETLRVNKERVAAIGFSAGAHLCGMLATLFEEQVLFDILGENAKYCRPDGVILGYPVVSAVNAHAKSFERISGGDKTLYEKLSVDLQINEKSSPAFIWGTVDDPVVPSDNGFAAALAYRKAGVPFEYHLFETCNGVHALALCEAETGFENETVKVWVNMSKSWLKNRGFTIQ